MKYKKEITLTVRSLPFPPPPLTLSQHFQPLVDFLPIPLPSLSQPFLSSRLPFPADVSTLPAPKPTPKLAVQRVTGAMDMIDAVLMTELMGSNRPAAPAANQPKKGTESRPENKSPDKKESQRQEQAQTPTPQPAQKPSGHDQAAKK